MTNKHETIIEVPEGMQIDKVTFKPSAKPRPQSWDELPCIRGSFISVCGDESSRYRAELRHKNVFTTAALAEASLAVAQLSQLRDAYRNGWVPDWTDNTVKNSIGYYQGSVAMRLSNEVPNFLAFETNEQCTEFYEAPEIKKLILQARPILGG